MSDSESDPRIADTLDETCHELREIADRVDDGEAEDYLNLAISNLEHVARWDREERGETPTDALRDFVTDGGLYEKYEVRKDGEPVEDCFVLEPESDPAAREALITYAEHTEDEELAADLREWVVDVCTRGEAGDGARTDGGVEEDIDEVPHEYDVGNALVKFDGNTWKVTNRMVDVDTDETLYRLREIDDAGTTEIVTDSQLAEWFEEATLVADGGTRGHREIGQEEPRNGESYDRCGRIRPVPPGVPNTPEGDDAE